MPVEDGIGYGDFTELKINHFSSIVAMHLAVTQAVLDKHHYFRQQYRYVDLTAGKGYTPGTSLPGSPIAFIEQAESEEFSKGYRVDLIEENPNHLTDLRSHVAGAANRNGWQTTNIHYHGGRYQRIVPRLFAYPDSKEFGLVFVDPSGNLPDFDTLAHVTKMRPKMDILIYVATTNVKRVYHQTGMLLSDYMKQVGKQHWLIRKPTRDSHKWVFLLGSGSDIFKSYRRIGFLRLDSEEAQAFFPKLNLTEKQRIEKNQLRLRFE